MMMYIINHVKSLRMNIINVRSPPPQALGSKADLIAEATACGIAQTTA
jgi:hypothetical protein